MSLTLHTLVRRALLGATLTVVMSAPSQAQLLPSPSALSVWTFRGNCQDCADAAGTNAYPVRATLTLNGYLGGALSQGQFVSFQYDATNLILGGIDVSAASVTSFTGDLTTPIQTVRLLFGNSGFFRLGFASEQNPTGIWSTCPRTSDRGACLPDQPADYGNRGAFTRNPSTTVPEPSSYALMAAGLAALGVGARRKRREG